MQNKEEIKEEAPVTTTANAGQPLVAPELPINKKSVFSRYRDTKKKFMISDQNSETLNNK